MTSQHERDRAAAHGHLMAAIRAEADAGQLVPCVGGLWWNSDDPQEQEAAAHRCCACHLIDECKRYVVAYPEPSGIWAGLTPIQQRATSSNPNPTKGNNNA